MSGRHRRVGLLVLVLHLGACATWRSTTVDSGPVVGSEDESRPRIEQVERTLAESGDPVVEHASLFRRASELICAPAGNCLSPDDGVRDLPAHIAAFEDRRISGQNKLFIAVLVVIGAFVVLAQLGCLSC